jgi:hypothetical protein
MRKSHSRGRDVLSLALFGPAVGLVYYAALRPPSFLVEIFAGHRGLAVAMAVLWVTLAAYGWRCTVVAFLRLCGFG